MIERKIGEIFRCATGDMVMCVKATLETTCQGCIYFGKHNKCADKSIGKCTMYTRSDGCHVVFRKIDTTSENLADDIKVLERIAVEYSGKTIENIIAQLKSRLSETTHI